MNRIMKVFYSGISRLLLTVLLLGAGYALQGQSITLGTPTVGDCTLDGNVPTSTVELTVSWTAPPSGDLIEVTLNGASVVSTNPVLINPATATSGMTVSFDALSDGFSGATIDAEFRTPISGTTSGPVSTAAFDIAANTCTGGTATICTDGTNSMTLTPADDPTDTDDTYSNVMWYAIDDAGVETLIPVANYGANDEIEVIYNGLLDDGTTLWSSFFYTNGDGDPEAKFYYTATDENGCVGELCVPVTVIAEVCYDLALTKTKAIGEPATYSPGDDVTFTFTVTNQGSRTAYDIDVTDYLPTGLSGAALVATPGVTQAGSVFTVEQLNGSDAGAPTEISFDVTFTIDAMFMAASLTNAAEISAFFKDAAGTIVAMDEDSTPDSMDETNGGETEGGDLVNDEIDEDGKNGGDEDDHDIETIMMTQVFDLALTKIEASTGPYLPGSNVTFTVNVYNQGTLDGDNIVITDNVPTGLINPVVNTTGTWSGTDGTVTDNTGGVFTLSALEAGENVAVDITFTIDENFTGTSLVNVAEITAAENDLDIEDEDSGDFDDEGPGDDEVDDEIGDDSTGGMDDPDDQDEYDTDEITIRQEVAIGNIIFSDVDGDGVFDAADGDAGIENVTVELYASTANPGVDAPLATVMTNADGYYIFDELDPGDYIVYIPGSELADGGDLDNFLSSIPEGGDDAMDDNADENGQNTLVNGGIASTVISLGLNDEPENEAGEQTGAYAGDLDDDNVNLTVDFAFTPEYRIGNLVWEDVDNDGIAEDGEPGIENVTVQLYQDDGDGILEAGTDDTFIGEVMTDADGKYEFTGLYQGDYIVVIPDAGAPDEAGTGNNLVDYYSSTTDDADPNSTTDLTGDDNNDNGANSATLATNGIDGLASAVITLGTGDSEPIDEQLRSDDPANDDTDGTLGTVPDNRSNVTVDFGFYQKLSLGDLVFFDTNNDGVFDADGADDVASNLDDEYGFAGVEVRLLDGAGDPVNEPGTATPYVLTTDPNGNYLFEGLDPGDYIVELVTPEGYKSSTGADDATGAYETAPDPDDGVIFGDVNNDDNGTEETATTIRSLPITLTSNGEPDDDGDTDTNTNLTLDFGIIGYSLGNYVWADDDNSGDVNGTEMGIANVTVRLLDENDAVVDNPNIAGTQDYEVMTDANGFYIFTGLPAGDYKVLVVGSNFADGAGALDNLIPSTGAAEEDEPDDDGDQNDNGLGDNLTVTDLTTNGVSSGVITLGEGDGFQEPQDEATTKDGVAGVDPVSNSDGLSNLTLDFGFTPSMSVGSTVFADANNNGTIDAGVETGITGVTVEIFPAGADPLVDTPINTDVTDGNGEYYFEGLPEGDYFIYLPNVETELATTPKSSEITEADPDDDVDGNDNGIQTVTGGPVQSGVFTLEAGTEPVDGTAGNAGEEGGLGTNLDDADDDNGNMTVDFGFYQPVDYGDLADAADGTATGDYETASANGGPSHIIVDGLQIGATVDDELDGQQSANADGDDSDTSGDDEDGVDLANITFKAGQVVNIPVTVTNNTGGDATLYAFVDWNNDGAFDGTGELVEVTVPSTVSGSQTLLVEFTIPSEADGTDINSTVGARFRLTTDTLAGEKSEGAATDGEVEDYVITISCPTGNCFGVDIQVQDKN